MLGIDGLGMLVQMKIEVTFLYDLRNVQNRRVFPTRILIRFNLNVAFDDAWQSVLLLHGLQNGRGQREKGIEDDKGCQRGEVSFVLALNVVADHVSGAQQQMLEGPLGVFVQKRNAVEGSFIKIAGAGLLTVLSVLGLPGLFPRIKPQMLPKHKGALSNFERMFSSTFGTVSIGNRFHTESNFAANLRKTNRINPSKRR